MCKEQFNESQPFVYDLRRPAICEDKEQKSLKSYKLWKFPKNYHEIVKYGKIKTSEFFGEEKLNLIYGKVGKDGSQPSYTLVKIGTFTTKIHFFYTLYMSDAPAEELSSKSYFEPFGFSRKEFRKYLPVFEILKTENPNEPYILLNETDADEKARNGELLYLSKFGKRNTTFYAIRNEFKKIEVDKSVISLSFVLTANFFKLLVLIITFLPVLLGKSLLKIQNKIARFFGIVFFLPFMPIKVAGKFSAALIKLPVLLFVANKEKYGDCYCTLWKHEVLECFDEFFDGISLMNNGKIKQKKVCKKSRFLATWKELDLVQKEMKLMVERGDDCEEATDVV